MEIFQRKYKYYRKKLFATRDGRENPVLKKLSDRRETDLNTDTI